MDNQNEMFPSKKVFSQVNIKYKLSKRSSWFGKPSTGNRVYVILVGLAEIPIGVDRW